MIETRVSAIESCVIVGKIAGASCLIRRGGLPLLMWGAEGSSDRGARKNW